jgi:PAS domain S-box-containing protein
MADLTHPEADHPVSTPLNSEQFLLEIAHLSQELEKVKQEKADLEIVLEAMTEHAGVIEAELHHEAEAAKQESQERFQLIAEATPVAIIIARFADGQLLYANAAASSIFGLPIEELLTHSMLDFYAAPNDRQKLFNIYTQNHCLRNYEIRFKQANSVIFWGAISIQPFSFNGEDVLLSAILDITKRKQADVDRIRFTQKLKEQHTQLQRLSVLKDEFLFNTSNELYTPLNNIVHTLQSLLATETPSLLQRPQNRFVRTLGRIPLRVILIVPFVVQVVGAVGLVGYLSFRNGQRAVNDLASQLRHEVTDRVRDRIQAYVEVPQQINQFNAYAIQLGLLDFQKIRDAELYFWRQVQTYESIGNVGFANQQGQFLRVGWINRLSTTEQPQIAQQFTPGGGTLYYYDIDRDGNRVKLAKTIANYDTRTRPYYTAAVQKGQPTWSEVYVNRGYDLLQIKASRPVYDRNNQLLGVLASELGLKQIGQFLQTLKIGQSGEVFIMEPTGELVASSMSHQSLLGGDSKRLRALESKDLLMRSSAAFLRDRFPNFNGIDRPYKLEFQLKGQRQFLQISPFKDPYGLNWLIVVVVPESDFMAQIHANNRITLWLCGATLVVAIVIGILTARWVTEPLVRLNFAAKDIAKGEWDKAVDLDRSDEVGQLAKSFNQMADQLKASFEALENHKNAFARFFPPEYLKFLHKQYVTHVHLGDYVSQEMAIMFSDIRSFTTLSESMTPQETFSFVNAYLQRVSPEIRKHQGIIVKYMGDGLMAIFPNRADDALQAGIAKLKKIRHYNQERLAKGYRPIYIGIGIHIGPIMVGMIGEENRMQGDALSDHVNLTARLEGLTKFYGASLLISEQVLERLNDPSQYEIRFLDRAIVKGKTESIGVYEVMDGEAEEVKALKFQTQADFERGLDHYSRREFTQAKHYFEQVLAVNLSDKTAKLYLERIERLLAEGVPENWNGVWAFAEK